MKAKLNGAKLIHVDPRFTAPVPSPISMCRSAGARTSRSSRADQLRDHSQRWNTDPFFKEFVVKLHERGDDHQRRLQGYRDLEGVSRPQGVQEPDFWPETATSARRQRGWAYKARAEGAGPGHERPDRQRAGPPFDRPGPLAQAGARERDATLQNPRCAFQS